MDRSSIQDAEVAIGFLPYRAVFYTHEMGQWSTVCYVASSASVTRYAEAKLSFMRLVNIAVSDRLALIALNTLFILA